MMSSLEVVVVCVVLAMLGGADDAAYEYAASSGESEFDILNQRTYSEYDWFLWLFALCFICAFCFVCGCCAHRLLCVVHNPMSPATPDELSTPTARAHVWIPGTPSFLPSFAGFNIFGGRTPVAQARLKIRTVRTMSDPEEAQESVTEQAYLQAGATDSNADTRKSLDGMCKIIMPRGNRTDEGPTTTGKSPSVKSMDLSVSHVSVDIEVSVPHTPMEPHRQLGTIAEE